MRRIFKTFINYQRKLPARHKSKRSYQYLLEQAKIIRQRVIIISLIFIAVFLIYFLFYSSFFKIENIKIENTNLEGAEELSQVEINGLIGEILNSNLILILPQDNYFLLSQRFLKKKFQEKYPFNEITLKKSFPSTISAMLKSRLGQSVWITQEKLFLINLQGKVMRKLSFSDLANIKIPVIYDLSNTETEINNFTLEQKTLELIYNLYQNFAIFNLPVIGLDYFKVDSKRVNYVKLVTKQGFEIHFNTILPLEKQIYKLKKSLESGKIDLSKISYINLRVDNQVIYK